MATACQEKNTAPHCCKVHAATCVPSAYTRTDTISSSTACAHPCPSSQLSRAGTADIESPQATCPVSEGKLLVNLPCTPHPLPLQALPKVRLLRWWQPAPTRNHYYNPVTLPSCYINNAHMLHNLPLSHTTTTSLLHPTSPASQLPNTPHSTRCTQQRAPLSTHTCQLTRAHTLSTKCQASVLC
jgi:hypothetical protein